MLSPLIDAPSPGFGIYVHWPFCLKKCPYCDFNSHVRDRIDEDHWVRSILSELDRSAVLTPGRVVNSVFFGGGTPSLMRPGSAASIIGRIARDWPMDPGIEITIEANPTSVEAEKFRGFRDAGINRASLGIQALNDPALKFLGREHSAKEAKKAIEIAAQTFERYSFDLIYARPGQTPDLWEAELDEALSLVGNHLSVYQLTIEQGTAFDTHYRRGEFVLPDDDTAATLYERTQQILEGAGMPAYEISNHARPGEESRHNLTYWRYGDYVGVGPGAHGRLTIAGDRRATRQYRAPETWLDRVEHDRGTEAEEAISPVERAEELIMMGLRLTAGIPRARFHDELGIEPEALLDPESMKLLTEGGFLVLDEIGLRATKSGRQVLNAVLARLTIIGLQRST